MKRDDVSVEYEELVEFELDEDYSILYSRTKNIWFIEDYSEDGRITILEDLKENILMKETFFYKDKEITIEELNEYKDIVENGD